MRETGFAFLTLTVFCAQRCVSLAGCVAQTRADFVEQLRLQNCACSRVAEFRVEMLNSWSLATIRSRPRTEEVSRAAPSLSAALTGFWTDSYPKQDSEVSFSAGMLVTALTTLAVDALPSPLPLPLSPSSSLRSSEIPFARPSSRTLPLSSSRLPLSLPPPRPFPLQG